MVQLNLQLQVVGHQQDTLPLAVLNSMQFGHALKCILNEILLANLSYGPVHLMKVNLSNWFYRITIDTDNISKLGVVAFPLVLPMGWTNSPLIFSTATETIANLANAWLCLGITLLPQASSSSTSQMHKPIDHDPSLPTSMPPLAYLDVFIDDFVGTA